MDGFFFRHDETLNFKITKHKRKFLFTKTSQFMTFLRRVQKSQLIAKVSAVQERKQFPCCKKVTPCLLRPWSLGLGPITGEGEQLRRSRCAMWNHSSNVTIQTYLALRSL